jgi:glycosyltransferase involved in cell wall biosynthesis
VSLPPQSSAPAPLVSVVIPAYRHEEYIEETLASVFAQTFRDFEVIVINDGSPDGTATRLRPFVESGQIQYHEQSNAGQSAARNEGIRRARGEFIALLDDDDTWPVDKLEWQLNALRKNPQAVAAYGYAHLKGNGQDFRHPRSAGPSGQVKYEFYGGNFIVSPGQVLVRTSALKQLGGLDEKIRGADDWDLWLRLADLGAFEYEDRCALNYRYHESNASRSTPYMFRTQMQVLKKHLGRTPFSSQWRSWFRCRRCVGRAGASPELAQAQTAQKTGRRLEAIRHLARAVRYDPPLIGSRRVWGLVISK